MPVSVQCFFVRPGKTGRGAFTLVEVVAAAAIIMLGLTFASRSLVRTMQQKQALAARQSARMLAVSKIEESFAGAPAGEGACPSNENMRWIRTIRQSSIPGMLEVEVAVFWPEGDRLGEYVLTTLRRGG